MAKVTGFFPVSEARWRAIAQSVLKSSDLTALASNSEDGIAVAPIYTRRTGPRLPREGGAWRIIARIDHPDPRQANDIVTEELANGAAGLQFIFAGAGGAYGYGLASWDEAALRGLLGGVDLDAVQALDLDLGPPADKQALAVAAFVASRAGSPDAIDLSFGLDPLGAFARSGCALQDWPRMAGQVAETVGRLRDLGFGGPFLVADGRSVHDAAGSPAQELAFSLACAIDYLRALDAAGFAADAARDAIAFRLATDADEFFSLCKFRALRLLWARALEACDLAPNAARLHGASAWRRMSARDPWINVMRGAMAAFCAGLGGADSVSVLPFTQAIGLPDAFARRLARNAQLILLEESRLGFVADPAAGSGALEALTAALCEKAWAGFQSIEARGGVYASLAAGAIQAKVAETAAARAVQIASRAQPITGVSDFPDLEEAPVATAPAARPAFAYPGEQRASPLTAHRIAEPFEAFRDRSDALLKMSGSRPRVFLAHLGAAADYGGRSAFAKRLFETGGIEALAGQGVANADEAARDFAASGAKLACLCSSDTIYAAQAEATTRALRSAGARMILAAGRPGESEATLRGAGVELFIDSDCDVLTTLSAVYARLDPPPAQFSSGPHAGSEA